MVAAVLDPFRRNEPFGPLAIDFRTQRAADPTNPLPGDESNSQGKLGSRRHLGFVQAIPERPDPLLRQ